MDDNGVCWTYQGTAVAIVPNPLYSDIIWNGNYFGSAGIDQYDTCEDCLTLNTKITLQFKVLPSFNGYVPSGATTTFQSPNFGVSFYDGIDSNNGQLFFPGEDVINNGVIVGRPTTLLGENPFNISNIAVGAIYGKIPSDQSIIVSVYINGELASQKTQIIEATSINTGVQIVGLFEEINCISNPCVRELNRGDILLITLERGEG